MDHVHHHNCGKGKGDPSYDWEVLDEYVIRTIGRAVSKSANTQGQSSSEEGFGMMAT